MKKETSTFRCPACDGMRPTTNARWRDYRGQDMALCRACASLYPKPERKTIKVSLRVKPSEMAGLITKDPLIVNQIIDQITWRFINVR